MEIERMRIHLLSEVVAAVAALMMKSQEVLLSFESVDEILWSYHSFQQFCHLVLFVFTAFQNTKFANFFEFCFWPLRGVKG